MKKAGVYYIYAQVSFCTKPVPQAPFTVYIYLHLPLESDRLLLNGLNTHSSSDLYCGLQSTHVGGVFELRQGDVVFVNVTDSTLVNYNHGSTYFGMFNLNWKEICREEQICSCHCTGSPNPTLLNKVASPGFQYLYSSASLVFLFLDLYILLFINGTEQALRRKMEQSLELLFCALCSHLFTGEDLYVSVSYVFKLSTPCVCYHLSDRVDVSINVI